MQITDELRQRLEELTELAPDGINPLHDNIDQHKVAWLVEELRAYGWRGAPVVVDGESGITGSHRIAACRRLSNVEGIHIEIPRIEIRDVCSLFDVDWEAHLYAHLDFSVASGWDEAVRTIADQLPQNVADYLGLDVH